MPINEETAIQCIKTTTDRYKLFEIIQAACEMRKTAEGCKYGYSKLVRTGKIDVHDYNEGILEFSIKYSIQGNKEHPKHMVQLYIASIDDSSAEAWIEFPTESECITVIDNFSSSVLKNMNEFPAFSELNQIVCNYGFWLEHC